MTISKCATCGRTFGSATGFDRHRRGREIRRCVDPATFGYVERDGVWYAPIDEAVIARKRSAHGRSHAVERRTEADAYPSNPPAISDESCTSPEGHCA